MSPKEELFQNPEYLAIFHRLYGLTVPKVTSQPFIPLIPDDWSNVNSKKIIWYGGASNGWGEENKPYVFDFMHENIRNEKWLETKFKNRNNKSQFWRVQRNCLAKLNTNCDNEIWNNVFKVGGLVAKNRGNPPEKLQDIQSQDCIRAFEIELEVLKPKLVVLHVGNLVNKILHLIAGKWAHWEHIIDGNTHIASYKTYNGKKMIWMSRRPYSEQVYAEKFIECLQGLNYK